MVRKNKTVIKEAGASQMAGPSGPAYDTTGNQRLESGEPVVAPLDRVRDRSLQGLTTYQFIEKHGKYEIFLSTRSNKNGFFYAVAEHPRTHAHPFKVKSTARKAAVSELKQQIDSEMEQAVKLSAKATIDFNAAFFNEILGGDIANFYAKIIPGPKLVIAGSVLVRYMEEDPSIMKQEGFKKGSSRRSHSSTEGSLPLPGIPLSDSEAQASGLAANGRYTLQSETNDADGNMVYDLELDSIVAASNDIARLSSPAFTVGTTRKTSEDVELDALRRLAGIRSPTDGSNVINNGSNVSLTGSEKGKLMKEHDIKPGTPEWFKLWFSRQYMTGEKPIGK
jgi:hypothetical protein